MARGPLSFKQRDLTRAIKAALAGGLVIERAWIGIDGRIMLGFAKGGETKTQRPSLRRRATHGRMWGETA